MSGTSDGRIIAWNITSGKETAAVSIQINGNNLLEAAAFTADSEQIIYADTTDTIYVADAPSGALLGNLSKQSENVSAIAPSMDGSRVAVVSYDAQGKGNNRWQVVIGRTFPIAQLSSIAQSAAPRCLTLQQLQKYSSIDPPPWCIEMRKWPYAAEEWKSWLAQKNVGQNPPFPTVQ